MNTEYIYYISPSYRSVTVWCCKDKTRERTCRLRFIPRPGLNRKDRYSVICERLRPMVPLPPYVPTKKEIKASTP